MSTAARFAAVGFPLTASHEFADHWVQVDSQAVAKGQPGREGAVACAKHVATYTATQALALYAGQRTLGLRLKPGRAAAALAISAVTHYLADRQGGHWQDDPPRGVVRWAAVTGHRGWLQRDPGAGYLMDQAWHKAWLAIAAAVATAGGTA
ncbi:hypothetical protein [Streptomyces sp. NPDC020983]|uniref:hypothetical protein n=1 Tax=Streptomyces sp. NPDC020983 TaxID=3365106 RepID=UPI0037B9F4F1